MKTFHPIADIHPVVYVIKSLILKLRQNPEIYPIKYFKKGKRVHKKKHHEFE